MSWSLPFRLCWRLPLLPRGRSASLRGATRAAIKCVDLHITPNPSYISHVRSIFFFFPQWTELGAQTEEKYEKWASKHPEAEATSYFPADGGSQRSRHDSDSSTRSRKVSGPRHAFTFSGNGGSKGQDASPSKAGLEPGILLRKRVSSSSGSLRGDKDKAKEEKSGRRFSGLFGSDKSKDGADSNKSSPAKGGIIAAALPRPGTDSLVPTLAVTPPAEHNALLRSLSSISNKLHKPHSHPTP